MNVGVRISACVCVLILAVLSECVLFCLPKETFSIIFSEGERNDTKRRRERGIEEMNRLRVESKVDMI